MRLMKTPKSVDLEITNRCNLRCTYCSHFESDGDVGQDLPKEEWLKFFEELNRCAVTNVTLSGGEAFIREDLKELIEGIVRNRMRFGILSNGTLITDEMAAFLASTGRCESVQVSIDGSMPITHDVCRGKGSFVKAINGIRSLQKFNLPVTVRVTIHRKNLHDLEAVSKLLLEDIGLPGFSTNSASHMGLCRKNAEQTQLTPKERSIAMETMLRLVAQYNGRIGATAGPLAEAKAWIAMVKASRGEEAEPFGQGFLTGCGGMWSQMGVRADGAMVPCCQMPHLELGRINKDDLKQVWQNHPELRRLRERCKIPLSNFEFCRDCEYINFCTGSCPALSYTFVGDVYHPSTGDCLKRFLEEGGRLPDERLLILESEAGCGCTACRSDSLKEREHVSLEEREA